MEKREGEWYAICCLHERIELLLPVELVKPSMELLESRFPYEEKPQEVYMDADARRVITFNLLEKRLDGDQVYAAVSEIQRMIAHIYPESIVKRARTSQIPAGKTGWFSYMTGGVEEDNYHIMFVLPVDGHMMLGSYHVPAGVEKEEETILLEILRGVEIREEYTGEMADRI